MGLMPLLADHAFKDLNQEGQPLPSDDVEPEFSADFEWRAVAGKRCRRTLRVLHSKVESLMWTVFQLCWSPWKCRRATFWRLPTPCPRP
eukprot:1920526-Alexandrium_andersonii.AAC.1